MEEQTLLRTAAGHFVRPPFRERFVHEALKKPGKLMARVCHQIEAVFEDRFKGRMCHVEPDDRCLLFTPVGRTQIATWAEALQVVAWGGGGVLVIDETGRHFLAQSEGYRALLQFAGDA